MKPNLAVPGNQGVESDDVSFRHFVEQLACVIQISAFAVHVEEVVE